MITSAARTQIFKRPEQHLAFERDGFVVLDFFEQEEIAAMLAHFESLRPEGLKGFYTTTFDNDPEYRTKVDLALRACLSGPFRRISSTTNTSSRRSSPRRPTPKAN
jgi:hypothetical protein